MKPLKPRRILLTLLFPLWALSLHARTFTDPYGRTIEGDIVSVSAQGPTIRLEAGGKEVPVPFEKLSKEDVDFVKQWAKDHPEAMTFRFRITAEPFKGSEKLSSAEAAKANGAIGFRVGISNQSGTEVSGISVKYLLFMENHIRYTSDKRFLKGGAEVVALPGTMEVGKIPKDKRADFMTDPIMVEEARYAGYRDDRLMGMIVRVYAGEKMVAEQTIDCASGMRNMSWSSVAADASKKGKKGEAEAEAPRVVIE